MRQDFEKKLFETITKQTEKVKYFCDETNTLPNIAVHETRKSFKRIRALLQFYESQNNAIALKYFKDFKYSGNKISSLRESFVNVQLFDRISEKNIISERKTKQVREILLQKNKSVLIDWDEGISLKKTILEFVLNFESDLTNKLFSAPVKDKIIEILNHSYLMSFNYYYGLEISPDGEEWHELRKKLKNLWYQIDFLKYLYPRYLNPKADQLNVITEQLGEDHDLFILGKLIDKETLKLDSYEQIVLSNKIDHLRQIIQVKLAPRLRQFFSETPGEFENRTHILIRK